MESHGALTVARLGGALNASNVEEFSNALHEHATGGEARLAVEMSQLESIDSTGLSALISLVTRARLGRGRVVLVAPTPMVRGVFDVTRLSGWFDLCADLEEASQRLTQP